MNKFVTFQLGRTQ